MVRIRAPWGIAQQLRTANLLIWELDSNTFGLQSAAAVGWRDLKLRKLQPTAEVAMTDGTRIRTELDATKYFTIQSADDSGYQTVIKLTGGYAELYRIKPFGSSGSYWRLLGEHYKRDSWLPSGCVANGTSGGASITWAYNKVGLDGGATTGDNAWIRADYEGVRNPPSFDKDRYFGALVNFPDYNQYFRIGSGRYAGGECWFGFYATGGVLYGECFDGTNMNQKTLESSPSTGLRRLEAVLTAGSKVEFYLDGSYVDQLTGYLPSGTSGANRFFYAWVESNGAASQKDLYIVEVYQSI